MNNSSRWKELVLPAAFVAGVLVIVVPLPAAALDALLAANLTAAVLILLATIAVRTPLEFNLFPTVLLATTMSRLVLNVASTRLILARAGDEGITAAGGVIQGFSQFVTGDNLVVGIVIFLILLAIQFVVITKGATRISEVAARFALDGMPGRQMAIDADLNAGTINAAEAERRRSQLVEQADFYGAMDGASKFVRGDAIAGLIITAVNIVGGLAIGLFQAGLSPFDAAELYTRLTIGDGLVSQLPALLISLAAGVLVSRSSARTNLSSEFVGQLFRHPQALFIAGLLLAALVMTNLPKLPLLTLGGGCIGAAILLRRRESEAKAESERRSREKPSAPVETPIEQYLHVDPLELEIGAGLIRLADPQRGGDLLARIAGLRRSVAIELGVVLPKVRVRDNLRLGEREYRLKIAGNPAARGSVLPTGWLAVDYGDAAGDLNGEAVETPAFGRRAWWIDPSERSRAESLGYQIVPPTSALIMHLHDVVASHADELLTRDALKSLLDELRKNSPAVVDELIPDVLPPLELQRVLQRLLRERVPIRQLGLILETLAEFAPHASNPDALAERVRGRLARTLSAQHRDDRGVLRVATLPPDVERALLDAAQEDTASVDGSVHRSRGAAIEPDLDRPFRSGTERFAERHGAASFCRAVAAATEPLVRAGRPAVLLTSPFARAAVRRLTARRLPQLVVMSYAEIDDDTQVEAVGAVAWSDAPLATAGA